MSLAKVDPGRVLAYIAQMQAMGSELSEVEAKDGRRGLPRKIYESLSALSNRRGGGFIVFGLEDGTFRPVDDLDVARVQSDLASFIDQRMSYPIRCEFQPIDIGGMPILAVAVPECPAQHKPLYDTNRGIIGGSYLRVGNSNHRLSEAEVRVMLRASDHDATDTTTVDDAPIESLSTDLIDEYRATLGKRKPDSGLLRLGNDDLLISVRALARGPSGLRPTVAGLLFFATEPQRWLPGAFVSLIQFPGTQVAPANSQDPIFTDNIRIDGPIPAQIEKVRLAIFTRIRKRALLEGFTRREIPEYPDWAYREAIVNAAAHRDYGISGSHIQVRVFSDRLEVQSPGGLFGTVSEASIEFEQSTRNHAIVRLLEDVGLVEQRGIGIDRMVREMLAAGLERPAFRDSLTSFTVTLKNHTMMDEDAYRWLAQVADQPLSDHQRVALVFAWRTGKIVNRDYQRLNSTNSVSATRDLRRLVDLRLLAQHGSRGSAFYTVPDTLRVVPRRDRMADERAVIDHVRRRGSITNAEGRDLLGIADVWTMRQILRRMVRNGLLSQHGTAKQFTHYEIGPEGS